MNIDMTQDEFRRAIGAEPLAKQPAKAKPAKPRKMSTLERKFADNITHLPPAEREYRFHPVRKWRLDFVWLKQRVAVELQGGGFTRGGHNRGVGQGKDYEKINTAILMGWKVLQFGTKQMDDIGSVIEVVKQALGETRCRND